MKIVVYCYDCNEVLDRGVVDESNSLLVFNYYSSIKDHIDHNVAIRLESRTNKDALKKFIIKRQ
jgi:hypothetical protein